MELHEIKEKLRYALVNEGIYVDSDDDLISDYIADSIAFVALIVQIECQLDIEFPVEMLGFERLGSLNSLSRYVFEFIATSTVGMQ